MAAGSVDYEQDFGMRLRNLRVMRGLSQQALGLKLGIKKPQISVWENQAQLPRRESVAKLAEALCVPPTALQRQPQLDIGSAESFGDRIKILRDQKQMGLREVARAIGVSHVAIVKWENNVNKPNTKNLSRLASEFAISVDSLISGLKK